MGKLTLATAIVFYLTLNSPVQASILSKDIEPGAETIVQDGISYSVGKDNAVLVSSDKSVSGAVEIPSAINGRPVEEIRQRAFIGRGDIISVTIPSSVTTIGMSAFHSCRGLERVLLLGRIEVLQAGVFAQCVSLKDVRLPESLISIRMEAFSGCKQLETIEIPSGVKYIGDGAFSRCNKLGEITLPMSLERLGHRAFSAGNVVKKVAGIQYLDSLDYVVVVGVDDDVTTLSIPDSVLGKPTRLIAKNAFSYSNLTNARIPGHFTRLGSEAFLGSDYLKEVVLGDGIIDIGYRAFAGCSRLVEIEIPDSVKSIDSHAFEACWSLKNIELPSALSDLESRAFKDSGLLEIRIPDSITDISPETFLGCKNLRKVILPEGLIRVGSGAFQGTGLNEITIPEKVGGIGSEAFESCKNLKNLEIKGSLKYLGRQAFAGTGILHIEEGIVYALSDKSAILVDGSYAAKDVVLPAEIEGKQLSLIADSAFKGAEIRSIKIPENVRHLGSSVFSECQELVGVELPNRLTEINASAFKQCSKLAKINIPQNLQTIESYAFQECRRLREINLPESVRFIGYDAFAGSDFVFIEDGLEYLDAGEWVAIIQGKDAEGNFELAKKIRGKPVRIIADYAFSRSKGLSSIRIPESVVSIGRSAFWDSSIVGVSLPSSLTHIGDEAFFECQNLMPVVIPSTVTHVGDDIFGSLTN